MVASTRLSDVAAHAGVSVQTVSNALNNPDLLKPATLQRVLASVDALGYAPNIQAKRLRQRTVSTIGLRIEPVTDNIASGLLDRFLHELTARADELGRHVLLFTAASDEEEVQKIRRLQSERAADQFVLSGTHPGDGRVDALLAAGLPFVAFGRPWDASPEHAWVDVDGAEGTRQATQALLEAGHRRIGFVGWPAGSGSGDDRRSGWAGAMREALGLDEAALERLTARSIDRVGEAVGAAAPLLAHVDALVCASDSLAAGAIAAAAAGGARLPVVGFDNTSLSAGLGFPSVDQSLDQVASAVLAAFDDPASTTLVRPRLVRRDDTRWGIAPAAERGTTPS